jgi:hypothetical protein
MTETNHCKRSTGSERAWFPTREEAVKFSEDPANVNYHEDIPVLCAWCGDYHLNRPEWLQPVLTARDAQFLEDVGVAAPQRMNDHFRCVVCGTVQRGGIEFLILKNGDIACDDELCIRESRCQS